jgi:hypothetical protein
VGVSKAIPAPRRAYLNALRREENFKMKIQEKLITLKNGNSLVIETNSLKESHARIRFELFCFPEERILSIKRFHDEVIRIDHRYDLLYTGPSDLGMYYSSDFYPIEVWNQISSFIIKQRQLMYKLETVKMTKAALRPHSPKRKNRAKYTHPELQSA